MADSASESDSSSIDGGPIMMPPSPVSREQLYKRLESLQQQNRVLKVELETFKLRVKSLQEENRHLRQASVNIQAKAEQEEEYISNTLLKKIQALKKEKETLAHHYEQEEECLTNDLSKKLNQLRQEKCKLEQTLEQEQECLVNKLMRKIEKLEAETNAKQSNLDQLRREKVELENTLEQEQEALVNRLWKRMDKLEAEKRSLQSKIETTNQTQDLNQSQGQSTPTEQPSPPTQSHASVSVSAQPDLNLRLNFRHSHPHFPHHHHHSHSNNSTPQREEDVQTLCSNLQLLRGEVERLKAQLSIAQQQHSDKMAQFAEEERSIREENLRLQRRLQLELERRESLCRHLSESESSLEMEDERHFHESIAAAAAAGHVPNNSMLGTPPPSGRPRPGSSPGLGQNSINFVPSPSSRPISPGGHHLNFGAGAMSPPSPVSRCGACNGQGWVGQLGQGQGLSVATSQFCSLGAAANSPPIRGGSRERFARPAPPNTGTTTPGDSTMSSPAPSPGPSPGDAAVMSPPPQPSPSPSPMDTKT